MMYFKFFQMFEFLDVSNSIFSITGANFAIPLIFLPQNVTDSFFLEVVLPFTVYVNKVSAVS